MTLIGLRDHLNELLASGVPPECAAVVSHPRTGHDDEAFVYKIIDAVETCPSIAHDPTDTRFVKVGIFGEFVGDSWDEPSEQTVVTIW